MMESPLARMIRQQVFDANVDRLVALNDEQWDFILNDQDKCAWAGGNYYGHDYHEREIYIAYDIKYVKTGLREALI
ncbi:hypothetical protein PSG00_13910 [Proteus mirabilis]|uniref:hypothetical protein n=1 Tax=Proteus mirabilis TaxID=584 RepID=UPI00236090B9|nr:hypothetical protein [Proteus mirabilis]MDC9732626.1 hypothetical protein [Proteus mirabilis]